MQTLAATVTSYVHATRALVHSPGDLLPPRKRFRDSISPEDNVEEDIDTDVLEDIEANATAIEVAVDRDVMTWIDVGIDMEVDVKVDVEDEVEDEVESNDRGTMEVGVDVATGTNIPDAMLMPDRIEDIEMGQRELESMSLIAGGERSSLLELAASLERSNMRLQGTMMMERARVDRRLETFAARSLVEEALAAYEATRAANDLEAENQSQNSSDDDNGNGGNGNPPENNRDARPVARE
ncbi:hypothetical protein Tco_1025491, partial [Tanacetum coccineum]